MFITEADHEFLFPSALDASGARYWRMLHLSLQASWFVLTVEVRDGEICFTRTACVAWDTDLVDLLEARGEAQVVGLLCMTPGWCSPTGQWFAREIREVWVAETSDGRRWMMFRDAHGQEFDDPVQSRLHEAIAGRRLILRIESSSGRHGLKSADGPPEWRARGEVET
jgi:hypothetical protein